jgi:hypothetical protein
MRIELNLSHWELVHRDRKESTRDYTKTFPFCDQSSLYSKDLRLWQRLKPITFSCDFRHVSYLQISDFLLMSLFQLSVWSEVTEMVPKTSVNFQLKRLIARGNFINIPSGNDILPSSISQPAYIILLSLVSQNDCPPCNHPIHFYPEDWREHQMCWYLPAGLYGITTEGTRSEQWRPWEPRNMKSMFL